MNQRVKEVRAVRRKLLKLVQELSRSKKRLWNEVEKLLPKVHLGVDSGYDRWLVLREKHRDGDRRVFVDLRTGTLSGDKNLILSLDPKLLNPERTISTLKRLIKERTKQTPL